MQVCWYLDDIDGLVGVLLEQQHAGGVRVDAELPEQLSAAFVTLVHEAKAHVTSEGERCQLESGQMRALKQNSAFKDTDAVGMILESKTSYFICKRSNLCICCAFR